MDKTITARATVGTDGVLHLDLPVGEENAGREVEVTVRSAMESGHLAQLQAECRTTVDALHGCIDDPTFDPRGRRAPTIEYPPGYRKMTREEWKRFIAKTAGSIPDPTFVRPPDMPAQDRGPIFP